MWCTLNYTKKEQVHHACSISILYWMDYIQNNAGIWMFAWGKIAAFPGQCYCFREETKTVFACIYLFVYVYIHEMSVSNACNVLRGNVCILYASVVWIKESLPQRLTLARGEFILLRSAASSWGTDWNS